MPSRLWLACIVAATWGCKQREKRQEVEPKPTRGLRFEACAVPDTANGPPESYYLIPKNCKLRVEKDWIVDHDARVMFAQGATIAFAKGTGLYVVHGRLHSLAGSSDEPVRFTSADASPAPGDWRGIVVHQSVFEIAVDGDYKSYVAGVTLHGAIIEYAGGGACAPVPTPGPSARCDKCSRGAFTVAQGYVASQRFYGATFRNNRDAQIDTTCARGAFGIFEGVKLEGSTPVRVQLGTAASIGCVSAPVVLAPELLRDDVKLPKGDYQIEQPLSPDLLTIAPESIVRIAPTVRLALRKLSAKGVLFTWMGTTPWAGLSLADEDSSLDGCTFEHAAGHGAIKAVVDLSGATKLHHVWDNTFRDVQAPAFFVGASVCPELGRQNNRAATTPLCAK